MEERVLKKGEIQQKILELLNDANSGFCLYGDNPYVFSYHGYSYTLYVKNVTDTDMAAKARGNRRIQLPYRDIFDPIKRSPIPLVLLGYDIQTDTFATWQSDCVKGKLNVKGNVSLYPRINQLTEARRNHSFVSVNVDGEGVITAFPSELLKDYLLSDYVIHCKEPIEDLINSLDKRNKKKVYNELENQDGILKEILDIEVLSKIEPYLNTSVPNRFEAYKIAWSFYGNLFPKMKLKHWVKLFDSMIESYKNRQ